MTPIPRPVGAKVKLTLARFKAIANGNRSIHHYPCDGFMDKISAYIGQEAIVTNVFPPGYETTIKFNDGQHFHIKDNWVESV